MSEANGGCERRSVDAAMDQMGMALHEMCQPLTTLQCRLELAGLVGTAEAYREAIDVGLAECSRLVRTVESMREVLRATRQAGEVANRGSG